MTIRLIIYNKEKEDISDYVTLENGKSNPFGWSQYEIHYKNKRIGWFENGYPMDFEDGYSFHEQIIETW